MKNYINTNTDNKHTQPIRIETLLEMIDETWGRPRYDPGSTFNVFFNEMLDVLHRRNIYTLDKIGTNHLAMTILNLVKRFGDDNNAVVFMIMCQYIFQLAVILGVMNEIENPAIGLDRLFPDKPTEYICDTYF